MQTLRLLEKSPLPSSSFFYSFVLFFTVILLFLFVADILVSFFFLPFSKLKNFEGTFAPLNHVFQNSFIIIIFEEDTPHKYFKTDTTQKIYLFREWKSYPDVIDIVNLYFFLTLIEVMEHSNNICIRNTLVGTLLSRILYEQKTLNSVNAWCMCRIMLL